MTDTILTENSEDAAVLKVLRYVESDYVSGSLTELADMLHYDLSWLSREIRFKNGIPVTTKDDPRYHGFGLKSMQQTVEKHNGSMTIRAQDGWFELRILFPL